MVGFACGRSVEDIMGEYRSNRAGSFHQHASRSSAFVSRRTKSLTNAKPNL
jgi:hypothetical protein